MAKSRVLKRESVFLTDPNSLAITRFERGEEIPAQYDAGDHLFEDEPDWSGTPQSGMFGRVTPFGELAPATAPAGGGTGDYDPGEYNADEVVEYVGDDQARAQAVLAAERDGKNRKGVVDKLEPVANPGQ